MRHVALSDKIMLHLLAATMLLNHNSSNHISETKVRYLCLLVEARERWREARWSLFMLIRSTIMDGQRLPVARLTSLVLCSSLLYAL